MAFNSAMVGRRQPHPATVRPSAQALASRNFWSGLGLTYHSRPVSRSVITPLSALVNLGWTGFTSAMIWPLAQPHTTDKIKAAMPKRDHRAILNPPAVHWGKIIIVQPYPGFRVELGNLKTQVSLGTWLSLAKQSLATKRNGA